MTNFVLLFTGGGMPEDEAEQAKVLQAWMAWYEKLGSAVVDPGNPFTPMAKSIAPDGTVSHNGQELPNVGRWRSYIGLRNIPSDVSIMTPKTAPRNWGCFFNRYGNSSDTGQCADSSLRNRRDRTLSAIT
jgi:hypothetical protein